MEICVDRLQGFFAMRPAVPPTSRRREVDACEEGGERRAVDGDLRLLTVERRKLEAPSLEAFREHAPARAVEPQSLRDPPALVEKQVEVAVDGIEGEQIDILRRAIEQDEHLNVAVLVAQRQITERNVARVERPSRAIFELQRALDRADPPAQQRSAEDDVSREQIDEKPTGLDVENDAQPPRRSSAEPARV